VQATKYFNANIGSIKTVDDFLKNGRIYSYAMTAMGLGDMLYAKGMVKKVLEGGVTDSKSLANTLSDTRFRALARAFDFKTYATTATQRPAATSAIVNAYLEQRVESDAGKQSKGVQLALYFKRAAPNLTSAYSILADKSLLTVFQTAFQISSTTGTQSIETQAATINKLLDLKGLKTPATLDKFITKFAALYDLQNADTNINGPDYSNANAILADASGTTTINSDTLMTMFNLKHGGS
jgi:hypothetical protein